MPVYNLLKYSNNYSKIYRSFQQQYRDDLFLNNNNNNN